MSGAPVLLLGAVGALLELYTHLPYTAAIAQLYVHQRPCHHNEMGVAFPTTISVRLC